MADKVHCIRKTLRLMPQEAKVLSDKAKANGMNEAEYILRNEQFIQLDTIEKEGKEIARKGILYAQDIQKIALVLEDFAKQIFSGMK